MGRILRNLCETGERCLKKVLGNAKLRYEELESVLIETEGVLNSRPLTYVYNELTETPLTPSHLVIVRQPPAITVAQTREIFRRSSHPSASTTNSREVNQEEQFK